MKRTQSQSSNVKVSTEIGKSLALLALVLISSVGTMWAQPTRIASTPTHTTDLYRVTSLYSSYYSSNMGVSVNYNQTTDAPNAAANLAFPVTGGTVVALTSIQNCQLKTTPNQTVNTGTDYFCFDYFIPLGGQDVNFFVRFSRTENISYYCPTLKTKGAWTRVSISLKDLNTKADQTETSFGSSSETITLFGVARPTGTNVDIYFDNIYIYKPNAIPPPGAPDEPAPNPVADRHLSQVKSLFGPYAKASTAIFGKTGGTFATNELFTTNNDTYCQKVNVTTGSLRYESLGWSEQGQLGPDRFNRYNRMYFSIYLDKHESTDIPIRIQTKVVDGSATTWPIPNLGTISNVEGGSWQEVYIDIPADAGTDITGDGVSLNAIYFDIPTGVDVYVANVCFTTDMIPLPPDYPTSNAIVMWAENETGKYTPGAWSSGLTEGTSQGNTFKEVTLDATGATYSLNPTVTLSGQNMFYMDVLTKDVPENNLVIVITDGNNNTYQKSIEPSRFVSYQWTSLGFPMDDNLTTIKSITVKGGDDIKVIIDNIVVYEVDNTKPVARILKNGVVQGDDEYSIYSAVNRANGLDGDIKIAVIRDSKEANAIFIRNKENVSWNSLTIYPAPTLVDEGKTTATVTYEGSDQDVWRSLFMFDNSAADVTIDGRLGGSEAAHSLILQGKYLGHLLETNKSIKYNNVIHAGYAQNVTITNCKFTTTAIGNRSAGTIQSNANNITITNNIFENCLLLGETYSGSYNDNQNDASIIAVDGQSENGNSANIVNISNNHFYETAPISYTHVIDSRSFIKVFVKAKDATNPVKIEGNVIGGTGSDPMSIVPRTTDPCPGVLYGINYKSTWRSGGIPANTDRFTLIRNNEIAHINIENKGDAKGDPTIASFIGVYSPDADFALVQGNKVHDISIVSDAPVENTQKHYLEGIGISSSGGATHIIIEENDVYNLSADVLTAEDRPTKSILVYGIYTGLTNNPETSQYPVRGVVRNNRVIMGYSGTSVLNEYSDIGGISARLNAMKEGAPVHQLDVYNNTVVLNENKAAGLRTVKAYDLVNSATSTEGVLNCYNNIALVQPKTSGSFSGSSPVVGINRTVNHTEGTTHVFHNTVFVSPGSGTTSAAFAHDYRIDSEKPIPKYEEGTLGLWNNNFVNLNPGGYIYFVYTAETHPAAVYFDYNNYYVPENGYMAGTSGSKFTVPSGRETGTNKIVTFDNWKFSNPLFYLDYSVEHDHHSRFLYPSFNATVAPANLTIPTISSLDMMNGANGQSTNLQSLLTPKRFIAGRKVELTGDNQDTKIYDTTVATDANGVVSVATTEKTTGTISDIQSVARREYLPTVGAINTSFTNYWNGTKFVDKNPSTSNTNPWEQDIVFANLEAGTPLTLTDNMSVHDIYNDTKRMLVVNGKTLTITGYIGLEVNKSTLALTVPGSTIIYAGDDGHDIVKDGKTRQGAATQHIFKGTFAENTVYNLQLNNNSQYFVLLHGEQPQSWLTSGTATAPSNTLIITNDFAVVDGNTEKIAYPVAYSEYLTDGYHLGGLNCTWYNTELVFSSTAATTVPATKYSSSTPYTYRPFAGQRIPRHGIFNDEVYDLTSNSNKVITYHDYLYVKNNLTINENKNFEIAADKFVRVYGATTNSGGTAGLVIKSRAVDTVENTLNKGGLNGEADYLFPKVPRPNATFIYNSTKNPDNPIPATVDIYTHSVITEGSTVKSSWQYFTVPVTGLTKDAALNTFRGSKIYQWNPEGTTWDRAKGTPYWDWTVNQSTGWIGMSPTEGYCISNRANQVYSIEGNLTASTFNKAMTYYEYNKEAADAWTKANGDYYWTDQYANNGKYILGNPYTAAVDIKKMRFSNELEKKIHIFNTGTTTAWINNEKEGSHAGTTAGTTLTIPQSLAGTDATVGGVQITLPASIPSMQAFTIAFSGGTHGTTTGSFGFSYNDETLDKNSELLRSSLQTEETHFMAIELLKDSATDYALLGLRSDCSKSYDDGWDGDIDSPSGLSVFTIADRYYQISTQDDIHETDLGIITPKGGDHKLTFHYQEEVLTRYERISLYDKKEDTWSDISAQASSYIFVSDESDTIQNRFRIVTQEKKEEPNALGEDDSKTKTNIYAYNKFLCIEHEEGQSDASVYVYDASGRCLRQEALSPWSRTQIELGLTPGVYLVRVLLGDEVVNQSVIIK